MPSTPVRRQPTPAQAAAMPPALWLTGTLGPRRRDQAAIRWSSHPGLLLPLPTAVRWDTVRMPAALGSTLLTELQASDRPERIGPVLLDERAGHVYWLTMLGTQLDNTWRNLHPDAELLHPGDVVHMPDPSPERLPAEPSSAPAQVTWAHWPAVTGTLTPTVWLAAALAAHRRQPERRSA